MSWAKDKLINELADRPDLSETIDLGDGTSLGRGYEVGNVAAFEYRANTVPEEDQLRADLRFLVGVLGSLYVAVDSAISVPGEETPEVADIVALVDHVARPRRRRSVRGVIRLSAAERIVIEKRAVQVAIEQLRKLEYTSIKDVGATESYDLDAHRSGERLYVEVKGTTSDGSEVVLTKNEVELHVAQYPATMLIVVTGIELRRDADPVEASNGTPHVFHPWKIGAEDLTPIAFRYTVPLGHL